MTTATSVSTIKKAILEKNEGNEVEKSEYVNLILDDMAIHGGEICEEDRQFLEGFTETLFLSLNSTGLRSLLNLPKMEKLERLELSDNKLGCETAKGQPLFERLHELYPNLRTLKLSNNQIKSVEELKPLAQCEKLDNLDLTNNPISKRDKATEEEKTTTTEQNEEYVKMIRELLPKLDVVDGFNKEGQEVVSEDEDDDDDEDDEDEGSDEDDGDEDDDEEEGEEEFDDEDDAEDDEEGDVKKKKTGATSEDGEEDNTAEKSNAGQKRKASDDTTGAPDTTKRQEV